MRKSRALALLAVVQAVVLIAAPSVLGVPLVSPTVDDIPRLTADDLTMLHRAVVQALDKNEQWSISTWSNSKTGHAGRVTVLVTYRLNGARCGRVQLLFTKGGGGSYLLPYCRQRDSKWKIQF